MVFTEDKKIIIFHMSLFNSIIPELIKMKKAIQYILVILLLTYISCGEDTSLRGKIEGKWRMTRVLDRSQDVTKSHNPANDRWVRFIIDDNVKNGGVFESGHGDVRDNTGKWTINGFELFIDSDGGHLSRYFFEDKILAKLI